jgi:beta-lactamase regulating signal transducer with metallopeptidase domain
MLLRLTANSSLRDRIGRLIKTDFGKVEIRIIGFSTSLFLIVTVNTLLTREASAPNTELRSVKSLLLMCLIGMIGLIVLLTLMAYIIIAIQNRSKESKEIAELKQKVKEAYSKALEQSSFNPHLAEPKHEHPRPYRRQ